jgi:hypothetical protein
LELGAVRNSDGEIQGELLRVLILDGNENYAAACVRSLAIAGQKIFVGADTSWSKPGWSRWCSEAFSYLSSQEDANAFVRCIPPEDPFSLTRMPILRETSLKEFLWLVKGKGLLLRLISVIDRN